MNYWLVSSLKLFLSVWSKTCVSICICVYVCVWREERRTIKLIKYLETLVSPGGWKATACAAEVFIISWSGGGVELWWRFPPRRDLCRLSVITHSIQQYKGSSKYNRERQATAVARQKQAASSSSTNSLDVIVSETAGHQ